MNNATGFQVHQSGRYVKEHRNGCIYCYSARLSDLIGQRPLGQGHHDDPGVFGLAGVENRYDVLDVFQFNEE